MTIIALLSMFFAAASAQEHNTKALEYVTQARDTANPEYHAKAEEALRKSFEAEPDNFDGSKAKTWLLLGQHRFAEALELAKKLNSKAPDDLMVYGFLVDANVELGNYRAAENAAQWMLDLRPGNIPSLARAAYLRELYKDYDGALQLMQQALQRTRPEDKGDRAWLLTHIGRLLTKKKDYANAEVALDAALKAYPEYHYALAGLAEVRREQKNFAAAVELYRRRYASASHPENLYDVGDALVKAGKRSEAAQVFAQSEKAALAESENLDNANRELATYYLQHARRPAAGLRIAEAEAGRRRDVHTLEVYAKALRANGKTPDARKVEVEIEQRLNESLQNPVRGSKRRT